MKAQWINRDPSGDCIRFDAGVPGMYAHVHTCSKAHGHPIGKPYHVTVCSDMDSRMYFETKEIAKEHAVKILKLRAERLLKNLT